MQITVLTTVTINSFLIRVEMNNYLSSSSDEEVLNVIADIERPRLFRARPKPLDKYNDEEFRSRYRLCKNTVVVIIRLIEEELSPMTLRNHSLSAGDQLLVTLRFYATGNSFC